MSSSSIKTPLRTASTFLTPWVLLIVIANRFADSIPPQFRKMIVFGVLLLLKSVAAMLVFRRPNDRLRPSQPPVDESAEWPEEPCDRPESASKACRAMCRPVPEVEITSPT